MDGLAEHAEELDRLLGGDADEVEHRVVDVAAEDVAGLVLGGRHPLERCVGEDLPHELRLRDLEEEAVLDAGSISKAWPRPICSSFRPARLANASLMNCEASDRVGLLHGVGGGEVVVLAGVDDDAGARDDPAREVLIDEGAPHVDVAEEDAVHGVVEQHVEPLDRRHPGDLGHAQAGRVVGLPDVAAELALASSRARAHDSEVLLGREGAAVALGGRAVGHVVEQRLRGRADDRDDVGAGVRGGLAWRRRRRCCRWRR